jgi:hypothetical protein
MGVAQEGLHSIKAKKIPSMVINIDQSKAYGVNWLFLRLILIHIGLNISFINWTGHCLTSSTLVVLISGLASKMFKPTKRARMHTIASVVLMVVEGLSKLIDHYKQNGRLKGVQIGSLIFIASYIC